MNNIQLKTTPYVYFGRKIDIYNPQNDDTIYGTLTCIKNNSFNIDTMTFADDDVVIDLGSNVGVLDLAISSKNPKITCYCFDASEVAINCLKINSVVNGFFNIHAFQFGVAGTSKLQTFHSNGKEITCLVKDEFDGNHNTQFAQTIKMIGILDIFSSPLLNLSKVKLFKIDIEGGEYEILKVLFNHLDILKRIEYFHIEFHDVGDFSRKQEYINKLREIFGDKLLLQT